MNDELKKENDNQELEECKRQSQEYLDNWKRERADFINYKKDETKRVEEFVKFANGDLILEAIEILDDLELAVKELKNVGLEQIIQKFTELFKKYGVVKIRVDIDKFDPLLYEAVEVKDNNGSKIEEVRSGYTMHGKVIRPARVRIIK